MKLTIGERLLCLELMPKEGNYITLKIVKQVIDELTFDETEIKQAKIQQTDGSGRITWDNTRDPNKDVVINDIVSDMIRKALVDRDKNGKLTPQYMTLYEKFVEKSGGK